MPLTTKHQVLAWDLAEGLGDEKHKGIYFRLAKIYDETFLRKIFSTVKLSYNEGKIKADDRGRYFMGILKKEIPLFTLAYADRLAAKKIAKKRKKYGKNIKNSSRRKSGLAKKGRNRKKSNRSGN